MREVNKPGTKNYSEEEFLTFVRRSLKEGWMPGKTPVPNAREPRIVGYRNNIPRIEALNYDEAFLFARLSSPPIEKFDVLYIIKGWEILRNSGIELSSREGGLNRKNYELRAEKGLVIPYKKISELAGDTANYQMLSVYPSDKAKLQSDEFVALVRGAQMKMGQTPDGILTDELIAFVNMPQTTSAKNGESKSEKDSTDVLIAKLYFISGDIDLYRLAMQETTKRPVQTIELQKLAKSASEILFANNFYKPVYPSAEFYVAVDEWGEKFKGDERAMDIERIRILANQEYNSLTPQRAKIEAEIKTIQERLANPYRNTNYVQGVNGNVNLNDASDQLRLNSLQQQLANMELPVLIAKYNSRQTFQTSSNLYHQNISNGKKNWNNQFFPTDNPYSANDSQYFTYGSFTENNASQKLIISHQFKETEAEYNLLASQMKQENGQTAADALAKRETELFNQRIETAKRLAGKTPIVKLWADMNAASINYQAKFSADQVVINVFSGKSITSRESTAVSGISASKNDTDTYDRILEALNTRYNGRDHSPSGQLIAAMYALFYAFKDKANTHILPPLKPGKMEPLSLRKLMLYAGMLFDDYTLPLIGKANLNERMKELNQSMAAMTEIKQTYGNVQLLPNRFLLRQNQQDVAQNNSVSRERRSMIKNGVCMPVYWKSDGNMYQLIVDAGDGDPKIVEFELDKTITDKTQRDTYAIKQLIAKLEQWNGLPQGFLLFTTPDGATHQKNFEKHITLSEVLGWLSIAVFVVGAVFTGGATLGLVSLTAAALSVSSAAVGLYEKSQVGNLTAEDWALGGLTALSSILPAGQLAGKLGTLTKGAGAFFGGNKLYAAVSVVSSATDSVVNGYIMTSDFTASFDELESIKDPKQKEEAKRKLLFMALLNGALTYHALKGDIGDLKALKAQGHLIPDDILLQKKLKPRDTLPSQLGDAGVLNETTLAKTALGTGMTDPNTAAAKQNVLTPDKLQTVTYNPAKGHEGWQEKGNYKVTRKTDSNGNTTYTRINLQTGAEEVIAENAFKQGRRKSYIQTDPPNQATHLDAPEVEPNIVAKATTPDGHTIKVDKTGDIGICSECTDLREEFADELIDNAELDSQLDSICAETDPKKKARLAAEFRQKLLEVRWKRNPFREDQITRRVAGDVEYMDIKLDNGRKVTLKKQPDGSWKVERWSGGEPTMIDAEILGRAEVGGEDKTIISKVDIAKNANGHYGNSGREYSVTGKITDFLGENEGKILGFEKIIYLNENERVNYEIFVDEKGKIRNINGDFVDTTNMESAHGGDNIGIFVMGLDGKIYIGSHEIGIFHHSSFLAGNPVSAAGEIIIKDGIITLITAKSGHYRPTPWDKAIEQVFQELTLRGVNTQNINIKPGF